MNNQYQNFITRQTTIHPNLIEMVNKYQSKNYLKPIPSHQLEAFEQIKHFAKKIVRPLIIDSGCGTGLSTKKLAKMFPDHGVIGIDKSKARLDRALPSKLTNYMLIRGNLIDQWRLIASSNLPVARHYLFFPNPWPKISHIKKRFHAHPIFNTMAFLAPYFELRTNWQIYAKECVLAFKTIGQQPIYSLKKDNNFMTLFEKKYIKASCPVYIITNKYPLHYPDIRNYSADYIAVRPCRHGEER